MKLLGITTVIRGQRRDEEYRNPLVTDGALIDGITYRLPLENWSAEQVFRYLENNKIELPSYYSGESTSHDCWDCTAYLGAYKNRIKNLPPPAKAEVEKRLKSIRDAIDLESAPLKRLLEE
jgi:3'-phosphoadenosine 5'-phosphosulfate sulfotransferase (PAPS reductase)/FAD synthetase